MGEAHSKPHHILAIARRYGVGVEWLVNDEAEWPPPTGGTDRERMIVQMIVDLGAEVAYRRLMGMAEVAAEGPPRKPHGFTFAPGQGGEVPDFDRSQDDGQPPPARRKRPG